TGALHAGSLVAALASWLDARAHDGVWLVRIEDVDSPRCVPGVAEKILGQLADCGLLADEPPLHQSDRGALYQAALDRLGAAGRAYPCGCSRRDIEQANAALGLRTERHGELVYPGTCRYGVHGRAAGAWRLNVAKAIANGVFSEQKATPPLAQGSFSDMKKIANEVAWQDRRLGAQQQDVEQTVGDFVLRRADGLWAYQLAVVVDDAEQGITDVVRGEDLAGNTARQIVLQRALGLPQPRYLHTPLVLGADGEKLSKQNGAEPLATGEPLAALNAAALVLGLSARSGTAADALAAWVVEWRSLPFGST
ncbi:MAG: tRNA glutamyl-Q(34) synthetase GluQRS, partial [Burkholderiales bacterium]